MRFEARLEVSIQGKPVALFIDILGAEAKMVCCLVWSIRKRVWEVLDEGFQMFYPRCKIVKDRGIPPSILKATPTLTPGLPLPLSGVRVFGGYRRVRVLPAG